MYTANPYPGKFEGNRSQLLAQAVDSQVLNGLADDQVGDCESFGFYAYIKGKRHHYILCEDSQGFVTVEYGSPDGMAVQWSAIRKDWDKFAHDMDDNEE